MSYIIFYFFKHSLIQKFHSTIKYFDSQVDVLKSFENWIEKEVYNAN